MSTKADFEIKNQRRRTAKQESRANYRSGRLNRAAFAWHGAFGNEVARVYNDCALGTSSPPRLVKMSNDEATFGSDERL